MNKFTSQPLSVGEFIKGQPLLIFESADPVSGIIEKMRESHTYAVAVTENENFAGLLTGQDILIRASIWQFHKAPTLECVSKAFNAMRAADAMTRNPITVEAGATLEEALHIMEENGYRYLPVTNDGRVIGILNIVDVAKYLERRARDDCRSKDEILSYALHHENYGCVSKD